MISAKSQLEKLVANYLGDYVEEYDSSSLSVSNYLVMILSVIVVPRLVSGKEISD